MYMKSKNVLQCRILKARKTDVNGSKVQTTAKYIQFDAGARAGINRCNAKTGKFLHLWYKFYLIKTEYLQLFMKFKNQKQKNVFPKTLGTSKKHCFQFKKCNYEIIIN